MKPPAIPLQKITALPLMLRLTVPSQYEDEYGHMNVRHYMGIYDEAGYPLIAAFGLTPEVHVQNGTGGFDLEHHIHYLNEVRIGDAIAIYVRVVGHTPKRIHYLFFMVNETHQTLASLYECVNSFADLKVRRTAPFPPEVAAKIQAMLNEHQSLDWPAPVCGVMRA